MVAANQVATYTGAQAVALERAFDRWHFTDDERRDFLRTLDTLTWEERECIICGADVQYFVMTWCQIYDPQAGDWIAFELWDAQIDVLDKFALHQLVIALKSRQVGLSWLALAFGLWQMLFAPIATVLIFSKRDDEAAYLLGEERMRGMYNELPDFLKAADVIEDNVKTWRLSNGSTARAFPTTAGDSYTATLVIVDEADLVPNLNKLLRSVKPTIDAGGKMFMISRSNKDLPQSEFKQIYRGAKKGVNGWAGIFLAWWVRPDRNEAWYERVKADIIERTGSVDDLWEQYPSTDQEALAPARRNKRVPPDWVDRCYITQAPLKADEHPRLAELLARVPGLVVYRLPEQYGQYAGGMDCAEGLDTSDDSATIWVDRQTGEEVASLVGKLTTDVHAAFSAIVSRFYNDAPLMVENNNHGHAVISWLENNRDPNDGYDYGDLLLDGYNDKTGWTSSTLGKVLMYDALANTFRVGDTIIHDDDTVAQIKGVEKSTLRAPDGELEDRSDAYALALLAREYAAKAQQHTYKRVRAVFKR